jgi:hypothetical protein
MYHGAETDEQGEPRLLWMGVPLHTREAHEERRRLIAEFPGLIPLPGGNVHANTNSSSISNAMN